LVVIVTPYLVKPVSTQMATPIDGYRNPNDIERDWLGQTFKGVSGKVDPTAVPAASAAPTGAAPAPGFKM
jgi:pilus assembly protein CpaC